MRRSGGGAWSLASLLLGCGPVPAEVTQATDGLPATDTSTGPAATGDATTAGSSSVMTSGVEGGSHGTTGTDGDTTTGAPSGTTTGELDTSTGSAVSVGEGSGDTSTSDVSNSGGESTGAAPTCDELYGDAPGYILCMETADECHFNATTAGGNCNEMCAMFSGTCVAAFDNPNSVGDECDIIRGSTDTCETNRGTELCVCSK